MFCPIMYAGFLAAGDSQNYAPSAVVCDGAECGIWDRERECCGLIARGGLHGLAAELKAALEKGAAK